MEQNRRILTYLLITDFACKFKWQLKQHIIRTRHHYLTAKPVYLSRRTHEGSDSDLTITRSFRRRTIFKNSTLQFYLPLLRRAGTSSTFTTTVHQLLIASIHVRSTNQSSRFENSLSITSNNAVYRQLECPLKHSCVHSNFEPNSIQSPCKNDLAYGQASRRRKPPYRSFPINNDLNSL